MAQRLEVARMLDEGCIYETIVEKTGASTATISRVKRCLVYGADGYRSVLGVLENDNDKNTEADEKAMKKISFLLNIRERKNYNERFFCA